MERHIAESAHGAGSKPPSQLPGEQLEPIVVHGHQPDVEDVAKPLLPMVKIALVTVPIVILVALIGLGALPRYFQGQTLLLDKKEELSQATSVSYLVAQPSPAVQEFALPGATEAILTAPLYARVNGYLQLRNVNIGDSVKTGQLLAEIETPELDKQVQSADNTVKQNRANLDNAQQAFKKAQADQRTAAANVEKSKSDLAYAKLEYARYQQLSSTGAVSIEDSDTRLTNYKGALSTLSATEQTEKSAAFQVQVTAASIKAAQAALDAAQDTRDQYAATRGFQQVRAPFSGIITARNVDPGALITSGSSSTNTMLFSLAKTDVLRLFVQVPEQYIPEIHVGQQAGLSFQAYPNERFTGTVTYVAGGLDPASRTLQVEIHIPNDKHRLLPGMYAQVFFNAPSRLRLAIVPGDAVQFVAGGIFAYIVDDSKHVHMHKVQLARDMGDKVEILKGISVGDKVVVNPPDGLVDGCPVNAVELPPARRVSK
jgi:RND family efflux transporter MFP subunit